MKHFGVRNFERFQHYRDRTPPWIKFYNDVLDDYDLGCLPDASKAHLFAIWLLASRYKNRIPYDSEWVARRINATEPVDLDLLARAGFLVEAEEIPAKPTSEQPAISVLAGRNQSAALEREGEGETESDSSSETSTEVVSDTGAQSYAVDDEAISLIRIFDAERAAVFGESQTRPYPAANDGQTAKAYIEAGATADLCRAVFRHVFEKQKAKGERPADSLRFMHRSVEDAIRDRNFAIPKHLRRDGGAADVVHRLGSADREERLREGRIESYRRAVAEGREPFWMDGWGPEPEIETATKQAAE